MREIPLAALIVLAVSGCEPTQLYIAHNTVVGLDVAVNTERSAGHLMFGYDRRFVALAPKSVKPLAHDGDEQQSSEAREVMSALSCTEVEVDGIFLTKYSERLATGLAARDAANTIKDPQASSLFRCWDADDSKERQQ